jgi:hypothetical protein
MRALGVGAIVTSALVASGCSGGSATNPDEDLAATLCGALREHTNVLVGIANDAAAGIHTRSPADRVERLEAGYAAADAAVADWGEDVRSLDLPDVVEAEELRADLLAGVDAGRAEIDDERAAFADAYPSITDGEVRGAVGFWFNSIEKVMSVSEPAIATYDRLELEEAFLEEPACRHVVQQFTPDAP